MGCGSHTVLSRQATTICRDFRGPANQHERLGRIEPHRLDRQQREVRFRACRGRAAARLAC